MVMRKYSEAVKVFRVIDSCKTLQQLSIAVEVVKLWSKKHKGNYILLGEMSYQLNQRYECIKLDYNL